MSELTTEQVLAMIQEAAERGQPVDLRGRDLRGIDLRRETVQQYADRYPRAIAVTLEGVNLRGANLEEAHLEGASLEGAHLWGARLEEAHLWRAHLEGSRLSGAHLEGADLAGAHLEGANLGWAHPGGTGLGGGRLTGARLGGAHLEGANLWDSALRGARFSGAYLDKTRFTQRELGRRVEKRGDQEVIVEDKPLIGEEAAGRWAEAKEAYLAIKQNFQSLGRYDDARWAYVKERQMERKSFFPSEGGDRWLAEQEEARARWYQERITHQAILEPPMTLALWLGPSPIWWLWWRVQLFLRPPAGVRLQRLGWLRNALFELLASYGESIKRPFLWALVFMAIFAGFYLFSPEAMAPAGPVSWGRLWDAVVFSTRSFATLSFGSPSPEPGPGFWAILPALEAMLGVSTLALVMYVLGRRMSGS